MLPYDQENIVAIATPPGIGALAVVRLSGKNLKPLFKKFTHKKPKDRFALFTKLYHPKKNHLLDEVVVTFFKSPGSFTGEDIIEISCHGGTAVKNSIVQAAIDGGARLAQPGEFSYRSFLNGKMDLIQAEAISAIISSKASRSTEMGLYHLEGMVSKILGEIKSNILDVLSIIENELNFSEEEIGLTSYSTIRSMLEGVQSQINQIVESSVIGKKIFSGIRIIILGRPNTGKSSLFNAILGHDRAITSPIAGTTRDTVEAWFELEGVPVCLIDTAGVWESKKQLDNLGVEKTISELNRADLGLLVDDENPSALIKTDLMKRYQHHYILVKSKSDLAHCPSTNEDDILYTSSKENTGINRLLTSISTYILNNINLTDHAQGFMITQRQRGLLEESSLCLNEAIDQLNRGIETDIVASTLNGFVVAIKDVVGEIPNKEIVQNIFSNFCVGK
ncbi:MAG: tRNA uridine-5-carboxymethylaminomethyl(34) synthesis GTPase MnmE [Candidatus Marinimicrobia bacterium]|nr:tRNA uridine-5-carboxymethylaminomethyl(34) synthesis GTPase MnmE [Candidatus Neomarinimicrobiota bacterium]